MKGSLYWPDGRVWELRVSIAQANAAGGAIVLDVPNVEGSTFIVMGAHGLNSGTNTIRMERVDEDDNIVARFVDIGSGAATKGTMPQGVTNSATNSDISDSTDPLTRLFSGNDKFTVRQTGAGAQDDTLIVNLRALLRGTKPTLSKARSTNQADVTIATPTVDKVL